MAKNKKKPDRVKPQILKGFRDYPPAEQMARQEMVSKISGVFELMGFLPLQTPSLEFASTLLGQHYNQDSLNELFGFLGPDEVDMALRYEFTVSLARYVAADPNIALPFRRYQYGNCWRVDKPGPGRYREFMQFDIDIVGTQNLLADSEIMAAMVTVFEHLGIERFVVRYSNRKILNGLIEFAGIAAERGGDVMRIVDKLEKQGREAVIQELGPGRTDKSGDKIPGLGLPGEQIASIEGFLDIAGTKGSPALDEAERLLGEIEVARAGIEELRQIDSFLNAMKINREHTEVDLTIVRGLGYYTGPVFETTLLDLPEYGSVFSGGRYDNLVGRFTGKSIPGVGSSIGPDRLLAALIELKKLKMRKSVSNVLVTVMDREHINDYLALVRELREVGIATEIFAGDTKNLTKQIKYGDKVGIPFAVIIGSDEFERSEVTVKNLDAGREKAEQTSDREEWLKAEDIQVTMPRSELISYLKKHLS
ncbi:MAG: histidine--tRNA ligase [bacterium]|nr:histidine--tRNA ligase [bacterium]